MGPRIAILLVSLSRARLLRVGLLLVGLLLGACAPSSSDRSAWPPLAREPGASGVPEQAEEPDETEATSLAGRHPTPIEQGAIDRLAIDISRARGLPLRRRVRAEILSASQIAALLEGQFDEARLRDSRRLYVTLGLLDASVDLRPLLRSVLGEQVLGYYDTDAGHLVLREDVARDLGRIGPRSAHEGRLILVHELIHALQDQQLGLGTATRQRRDTDAENAFRAVVEGDATLGMLDHMLSERGLELDEFNQRPGGIGRLLEGIDAGPSIGALADAPAIVRHTLLAPYARGVIFAAALHARGGWPAIDSAHARPPTSTEQVLHPEKYLARELADPISLPAFAHLEAEGWRPAGEDSLGELEMAVYLGIGSESGADWGAAEGWSGDRLRLYEPEVAGASDPPRAKLVWFSAWDDLAEAAEAETAARRVVGTEGLGAGPHWVERRGRGLLILRWVEPSLRPPIREAFARFALGLMP
ncbi:MAG: hypothetical protein OEY14_03340 [Myxococcales bacterium]|nr:hypothetical protein [Myxococcales bacterium]